MTTHPAHSAHKLAANLAAIQLLLTDSKNDEKATVINKIKKAQDTLKELRKQMNEQERIDYSDIMSLGFYEEYSHDTVYYNQFGFEYSVINKNLTPLIYLDWAKETQLCQIVRINNEQDANIVRRMPIKNLQHLKILIEFFCDEPKQKHDIYNAC
jgi:hypothetical protein